MPDKMTPERALIVLNQCNTDGRIKVDREELKEAVKVASEAIKRGIPRKPDNDGFYSPLVCRVCNCLVRESYAFCPDCGQAIDWSDLD